MDKKYSDLLMDAMFKFCVRVLIDPEKSTEGERAILPQVIEKMYYELSLRSAASAASKTIEKF